MKNIAATDVAAQRKALFQYTTRECIFLVCLMMSMGFAFKANAASFDCRLKTLTSVEATICASRRLSELDTKLDQVFNQRLKSSPYKAWLRQQQRIWISERDDDFATCGEGAECVASIESKYRQRVVLLQQPIAEGCARPRDIQHAFSGSWGSEKYLEGRRYGEFLDLAGTPSGLMGEWREGVAGGRVAVWTVRGEARESSARLTRCDVSNSTSPCNNPQFFQPT